MNNCSGQHQLEFMKHFDYIREAGTPGEATAAKTLVELLHKEGADAYEEAFTIPRFIETACSLRVCAPYEKDYAVKGYLRSLSMDEPQRLPFVYLENGDEYSLRKAKGAFVLVNQPVDASLLSKLVDAGAKGFASVYGTPIDTHPDSLPQERYFRGKQCSLPGFVLHIKDAAEIVENGASEVIVFRQEETSEAASQNVIARIKGSKSPEILTISAHYDSVPFGKGAYDNLAGAAIAYELLCYFLKHPSKRELQFLFFGSEERGLLGSKAYVEAHQEELPRHRFNLNIDLAGQCIGGNVFGITGDASIAPYLETIVQETGIGVTSKTQVWSSDSNSFAKAGIPAMTLNRDGFGMHTRHDTLELISPWSLQRSAELLLSVTDHLANIDTFPFERIVPKEFLEILNRS